MVLQSRTVSDPYEDLLGNNEDIGVDEVDWDIHWTSVLHTNNLAITPVAYPQLLHTVQLEHSS